MSIVQRESGKMESEILKLKQELAQVKNRLALVELELDNGIISSIITLIGKKANDTLFSCVEDAISEYFGVDKRVFYGNIISVGNRKGRKGKFMPFNPSVITSEDDRIATARFVLYGIIHIDFGVSISDMSSFYDVGVKNYIREWKARYIRIFHSESPKAKHDDAYKGYWEDCHALIVKKCHEKGLYKELFEKLKLFDSEGELSYIYINKWRL